MTEIRTKDKLFLAAIVPLALLGAYWYGWRADAARLIAELERRQGSLVAEEDFPMEKRRADAELAEALSELKAAKAEPPPQTTVKADSTASAAQRERQVLQVFREAGLRVAGSATPQDNRLADGSPGWEPGEVLRATGVCPAPVRREYVLDGRYPEVVRALESFVERQMAVIPDCVKMRTSGRNRWTLEVWQ